MSEPIHFRVQRHNDVIVLRLLDAKLQDTQIVSELEDELLAFLEDTQPTAPLGSTKSARVATPATKLVVDFKNVTRCSTVVINGLLRAKKRLLLQDGELRLCGMRRTVRDAYRILNLDGTVFQIYDSVDQATMNF